MSEIYFFNGEEENNLDLDVFSHWFLVIGICVTLNLRANLLLKPICFMYLTTVSIETSVPVLHSSSLMRGLPYRPFG